MNSNLLLFRFTITSCLLFATGSFSHLLAQDDSFGEAENIIQKIEFLESNKDPKCYATANRLEDFMYGTPLNDDARNFRIEVQKELNFAIRQAGSKIAIEMQTDSIQVIHIKDFIEGMALFGELKNGDLFYQVDTGFVVIPRIDFDQYASVAYNFRSMLSLEQDLFFLGKNDLLPWTDKAIHATNYFINLNSLVALKMADAKARSVQNEEITASILKDSWIKIFQNRPTLFQPKPQPSLTSSKLNAEQNLVKKIIQQKLASYDKYNQLSTKMFVRNIQVFFARQKWPTDAEQSSALKNYFLESLVFFASELIKQSNLVATEREDFLIRVDDVQKALQLFMPFSINQFEDVTYFPVHENGQITIESYDLDAFRDSGIHWRILDYSLDDLKDAKSLHLDPNAAELVVEGIAQLGVLVLRLAGQHSHQKAHKTLTQEDIQYAFTQIQNLINTPPKKEIIKQNAIVSTDSGAENIARMFKDITKDVGLDFEHKSSDWLNRLIRSYVFSKEENTIKMAIPPAFGGGGVAAEDINQDNLVDILLLGGFGNKLYINQGNNQFKDISAQVPINKWNKKLNSYGEPRQPIIADFDNDGWQDIMITYVHEQHLVLKNINGTEFKDVSAISNLDGTDMVAGPATVLDYDNDGLLDIYIGYFGNYIKGVLPTLSRDNLNGMPNKLYRNKGGFQFEEVEFTKDVNSNFGWTQAVGHADINQDNRQDIIVGNDFGLNKYYLNTPDGFVEQSKYLKTDKPSYTMNIGIGDVNRDLFPDFYISNIVVMQKEEKYVQPNANTTMKFDPNKMTNIRTVEANDLFLSTTSDKTLQYFTRSNDVGRGYSATGWSWDADFFDYDNDGDEDLYCLNGMNDFSVYSSENPFYFSESEKSKTISYAESNREKNVFFVNENGKLINKAEEIGTDLLSNSRSASYLDFDNDGDLDIVINNYHDKATFLENSNSNSYNWIKIKLVGNPIEQINQDAIGSSITVNSEHHPNSWREIHSTTGYLSVHPKEQHFGLGKDKTCSIIIKWSNGKVTQLDNLDSNKTYQINYPDTLTIKY